MTHTVADAEAAIARHPESLEQLSMAADLMQELGDPRGEGFAACLDGSITAEEVMRRHPADVSAMYVAAWRIESDGRSCCKCDEYIGVGQVPSDINAYNARWITCPLCGGSGDDGASARAEALRLLAECGKVGEEWDGLRELTGGYFAGGTDTDPDTDDIPPVPKSATVSRTWVVAARDSNDPVVHRLALLDAYAEADPDTRRRWAEETRSMAPQEGVTA